MCLFCYCEAADVEEIRLVFAGQELEEHREVADYHIKNGIPNIFHNYVLYLVCNLCIQALIVSCAHVHVFIMYLAFKQFHLQCLCVSVQAKTSFNFTIEFFCFVWKVHIGSAHEAQRRKGINTKDWAELACAGSKAQP